jgi:ubiquinone/menaquinone biosynthesis C-methylase UbiE
MKMINLSLAEISKMVISAYDNIADTYTGAYAETDDYDAKYLEEFVLRLGGNTILDMGCGTGTNTNYLAKKGLDVVGIDASKNMLNVAKKFYPAIRFEKQNLLHTSYEAESFDGVVLAYVINHFNQEGLILIKDEINRILMKGGLLFVSAHVGTTEVVVPEPLDESIQIYFNYLTIDVLDALFSEYKKECCFSRKPRGGGEGHDKIFVVYRK